MLLSRLLANFTRGESDMLRKAMGKKQIDKMQKLKKKFMEQGMGNGHPEAALNKIWEDWEKFASYAFNKSHATCYTWVAYQTAYLKAHYPAEYMAGVMSRNLSMNDKLRKVMDECKRMGLTVLGPDVNESNEKFGVNKKGEIRFGLGAVKGVGVNAVSAIIHERMQNGPFKDPYDFVERVNLSACNRSAIENLAMAGAFDCFGWPREAYVTQVFDNTFADMLVKYGQRLQNDKNSLQLSLFGDFEPIETAKPPLPEVVPWSRMALLDKEKELVTMYLSAHPLDPYYMELTYGCNTSCEDYKEKESSGGKVVMGGLITKVTPRTSRRGTEFTIVEVEDFSGKAEIALFGKNHAAHKDKFRQGEPTLIKLTFAPSRYDPQRMDLTVDEVSPLESIKGKMANEVTVFLDMHYKNPDFFSQITRLEDQSRPGNLFIELIDTETKQTMRVRSRRKFPINRQMVSLLEESGVRFRIQDAKE